MKAYSSDSFYFGLQTSTKEINQNFRIKLSGVIDGEKFNTLIGVSGLIELVEDIDLVNRLIERSFSSKNQSIPCKLRRGIKITFYSK